MLIFAGEIPQFSNGCGRLELSQPVGPGTNRQDMTFSEEPGWGVPARAQTSFN